MKGVLSNEKYLFTMNLRDPESTTEIIEYSFNYPYHSSTKLKNYISILITTMGFAFIFSIFLLLGYLFKLRNSIIHDDPIPKFEDYGELFEIGKNGVITYLPLVFSIGFIFVASQFIPVLFGLILFPFLFWPIISFKFAEHLKIDRVYEGEVFDILLSKRYGKYYFTYAISIVYLITALIFLGAITLGIGFILMVPIFLTYRACFWAYAIKDVRDYIDENKENESKEDGD